jgi:hypothetical protein
LLLLTATTKLVGLESSLRLEVVAAMLGDVPFRHGCGRVRGEAPVV